MRAPGERRRRSASRCSASRTSGGRDRSSSRSRRRRAPIAADDALLFRTAVKQICRRLGYHATFMARPGVPRTSSPPVGTCTSPSRRSTEQRGNAFTDDSGENRLSRRRASNGWPASSTMPSPASVFTTPTINGYKRYRPDSFAPDRVSWAVENRGSMLRVIGEPGSNARAHREPDRRRCRQPLPLSGVPGREPDSTASRDGSSPPPSIRRAVQVRRASAAASLMEAVEALARRLVLQRGVRRAVRRLHAPVEGLRDQPVPSTRDRLGAARVLRDVLIRPNPRHPPAVLAAEPGWRNLHGHGGPRARAGAGRRARGERSRPGRRGRRRRRLRRDVHDLAPEAAWPDTSRLRNSNRCRRHLVLESLPRSAL